MGWPVLEVKELRAGYGGGEVLQDISFAIQPGEIVALLGRNGMGKTTVLRCLMGLLRPNAGKVIFENRDVTSLDTHEIARRGIAYVPQGRDIFSSLTVAENLQLGALRGGKLDVAYELFPDLKTKADAAGGSLSGGQQQQLAIARALLSRPKLLLLDEPSEGIQPSIVQNISTIVARSSQENDMAVLIVEQNTDLALSIAARVLFLDHGTISANFTAQQVTPQILEAQMGL